MILFSLRDKRLFEIIEVEITRVDCNLHNDEVPGGFLRPLHVKLAAVEINLKVDLLEAYHNIYVACTCNISVSSTYN